MKVGVINLDQLQRDRDQLWAEARERFFAVKSWWLDTHSQVAAASEEQQDRFQGDVWEGKIIDWASRKESVSIADVLDLCLEKPKKDWSRADEMRIAKTLKSNGWIRKREALDAAGSRPYRYWRVPTSGRVPTLSARLGQPQTAESTAPVPSPNLSQPF